MIINNLVVWVKHWCALMYNNTEQYRCAWFIIDWIYKRPYIFNPLYVYEYIHWLSWIFYLSAMEALVLTFILTDPAAGQTHYPGMVTAIMSIFVASITFFQKPRIKRNILTKSNKSLWEWKPIYDLALTHVQPNQNWTANQKDWLHIFMRCLKWEGPTIQLYIFQFDINFND